jgi:hypothetical protein
MRFDKAELEGLLSYRYGKRYTYSVLALLYPWLRFDQRFHIDHIFPRSMFDEAELAERDIPPEDWEYWLEGKDNLANLQLLQGTPNQEKSDKPFADWLEEKFASDPEREAYRERHLIPDVEPAFENFPMFMAERETLILEKLNALLEVGEGGVSADELDFEDYGDVASAEE